MLDKVIALIEEQQRVRLENGVMLIGELLKDIVIDYPEAAEKIYNALKSNGKSISDCAKDIDVVNRIKKEEGLHTFISELRGMVLLFYLPIKYIEEN